MRVLTTLRSELDAIEAAILGHCAAHYPDPPTYRPEEIKALLKPHGWLVEARVPMLSAAIEQSEAGRAPNDRYDLLKFFRCPSLSASTRHPDGDRHGIEGWKIQNDLKFRRGFARGQIACGVFLQPDPATLRYCYEHVRVLTAPLFADIPIAFLAPDGPGFKQHEPVGKQRPGRAPNQCDPGARPPRDMLTSMSRKVRPVGEKPRGLQAPRPTASRSVCWLKLGATWVPLTRAEAPEEITRFLAARVAH